MGRIEWYYAKNGIEVGPISPVELKQMAVDGEITPDDLVWHEGLAKWSPARKVRGLFAVQQPPTTEPPQSIPDLIGCLSSDEPAIMQEEASRRAEEQQRAYLRELAKRQFSFWETSFGKFIAGPLGLFALIIGGAASGAIAGSMICLIQGIPAHDLAHLAFIFGFSAIILWGFFRTYYGRASEGRKCPRCKRQFAGLLLDQMAFKVGDGVATVPSWQRITSADGRHAGYLDGWQQVQTEIVEERYERICKFCSYEWTQEVSRELIR